MLNTEICPCGSGLRKLRCCDADFTAAPNDAAMELLTQKAAEATTLFNEKKHPEAEALALKLLDLAPNLRPALRVLFEIRRTQNKQPATEALARRLANLPADNTTTAGAQLQLAQLLVGQGRHLEAEPAARIAVKLSPREPTVHHVMGVILTETGRLRAGEQHYRKALRLLERDDGMVQANLAWNLKLQGRLDEAADLYTTAIALRPDNARGIGGHAQVQAGRDRLDDAAAMLDAALTTWPTDRTLRLLRALTDLQAGNFEAVLTRLDAPLETLLPPELAARGQAAARLDRIADAIACFAIGRQMQRERYQQSYQPDAFLKKAEAYKAFFTADKIQALPRAAFGTRPQPVFLLGFARSGSALLEQLLAKIPGFTPVDGYNPISNLTALAQHLAALHAKAAEQPYPQALDDMVIGDGTAIPTQLRNHYLDGLTGMITPQTKFITDRAPDNHWHLGLIKLLFPDAPIIHLIRHPLDIALSNFGQDKALEANAQVSMPAIARHYDFTMSLIKHFRGQLTLRYLPVRYEDLVTNPTATLTTVLNFIGADPAGLPAEAILRANDFQPQNRMPAHAIMREPMHQRGLYRYRAYEAERPALFSDIRPIMDPWIAELGYGDTP
jgi:tetratricopeptide (TPR) repeat protein